MVDPQATTQPPDDRGLHHVNSPVIAAGDFNTGGWWEDIQAGTMSHFPLVQQRKDLGLLGSPSSAYTSSAVGLSDLRTSRRGAIRCGRRGWWDCGLGVGGGGRSVGSVGARPGAGRRVSRPSTWRVPPAVGVGRDGASRFDRCAGRCGLGLVSLNSRLRLEHRAARCALGRRRAHCRRSVDVGGVRALRCRTR
jgi:hypothetical protein